MFEIGDKVVVIGSASFSFTIGFPAVVISTDYYEPSGELVSISFNEPYPTRPSGRVQENVYHTKEKNLRLIDPLEIDWKVTRHEQA